MKSWPISFMLILVCTALMTSGCAGLSNGNKQVNMSDLIIPLNMSEVLKRPETEVIAYFQDRRDNFESLGNYMLENERLFQARPVILHPDSAIAIIQDPAIREFVQQVFQEGVVMMISSLNDDPNKRVDIWIDSQRGLFRQGVTYVSRPEMNHGYSSILNYVENYKDLGDGWYYYVYHYDSIHEEELYRELAWNKLSDKERSTLTFPKEEAIVALETGATVGIWIDDRRLDVVVSVEFRTESDGILGPIKAFFDPLTKELVGGNPRL
jgi:hypothetical protein